MSEVTEGDTYDGSSSPQGASLDAISPQAGTGQPGGIENAPAASYVPEDDQTWEQRFRSLQGRHEQSQRNNQALADRIGELENLVASMRASGSDPGTTMTQPAQNYKLLTPEEETDYEVGDGRSSARRPARTDAGSQIVEAATDRPKAVSKGLAVMQRTERRRYDTVRAASLGSRLTTIKGSRIGCKSLIHTRSKRYDMLMDAFTRQDTQRVIQFFKIC